jgi:hypothetical protein
VTATKATVRAFQCGFSTSVIKNLFSIICLIFVYIEYPDVTITGLVTSESGQSLINIAMDWLENPQALRLPHPLVEDLTGDAGY